MPGHAFTLEKLLQLRTNMAAKSVMWLASRFAAPAFSCKTVQKINSLESAFENSGRVDRILFKVLCSFCDNATTALHVPKPRKHLHFFHTRVTAGLNFNSDYWSNYFPRLATSSRRSHHFCGVLAFTPEILWKFQNLCQCNILVRKGPKYPWKGPRKQLQCYIPRRYLLPPGML